MTAGTVTSLAAPGDPGLADGTVCKCYTETVNIPSKKVTQQATACKAPGGTWKLQG